jgi:hypothetical protein
MPVSLPYPIVNGTTGDGTQMQTNLVALLNGINASAQLNSPTFTGIPTGPTAVPNSSTAQLATTAFVTAAITAIPPVNLAPYAPLASPTFTGTPLAPTPINNDNSTKIATTAYVQVARLPNATLLAPIGSLAPAAGVDQYSIIGQNVAFTLANSSPAPLDGQGLVIRIKDNGTAQTIAYGTQYRGVGIVLPTTTIINKVLYLGMVYNSNEAFYDIVSVVQQ